MSQQYPIEQDGLCHKCHKLRKVRLQNPASEFRVWLCGTCLHREERRINTREMWGKGRRGY